MVKGKSALLYRSWYGENPGVRERPALPLQYPINFILQEGATVMVNNDEEMRAIYAGCDEDKSSDNDGDRG
jgi:hypothetical protein